MSSPHTMLRPEELELAIERMKKWPKAYRDEVLSLPKNERDWFLGLAALLDARPVEMEEQEPAPSRPDPERTIVGRYHSHGPDTERIAAALVAPRAGSHRARVLELLRLAGEHGSTDYELWLAGGTGVRPHAAGTRREELIRDGWPIIDTGYRRPTDTGSPAIVWRLDE